MSNSNSIRHILALELNTLRKTIFLDKNTYSIGRNSTNSIVLYHRVVSRNHATLLKVSYIGKESNNDVFWIIDGDLKGNRSTNGIYVNGKRCLSCELQPGDLILLGGIEVKAKYDIIDINSKTLVSLLKEEEPEINDNQKDILLDEKKSTFIDNKEENKEPLTEQFISKISSIKDLFPHPIIEVNLTGEITEINSVAEQKFPDIKELKMAHPILQNLNSIFEQNQTNLLVREITINNEKFTQYAHYLDNQNLIRNYLLDLKKRQQLELALTETEERYEILVEQTSEGIFFLDVMTKKILYANSAYCDLVGYSLEELLELNIYDIVGIDRDILQKDLQKIIKEKNPFIRESIHRCKNGSLLNVEVSVSFVFYNAKQVLCFTVKDITERKRAEEILRYQASHDLLTNLPNQRLFTEQLSTSLNNAQNSNEILALIFIKLDRFKNINYILGHDIGDQLLQNFAKRIKACLRSGDTIARWGGDEFTILLPEINNADNVANISQTILDRVVEPFVIDEHKIYLDISLGIAIYPQHGKDASTLLKNADAALYRTQQSTGTKYKFYTPQMTLNAEENLLLENLLHSAIKKEEFELLYQPQINVKNGEIISLEPILKWNNSELGELFLDQFLAIAEESNLIIPLNYWMIKTACKQNQIWQQNQLPPLKVSVKLYFPYLQYSNFLSEISQILAETRLDPSFLELEIQEINIVEYWESSRKILKELKHIGVNISLDNFGSGYSSLNYLRKFPFHKLKISEDFIQNLDKESESSAIISAIITLALGFNMEVIAKGVNTLQQMELLVNLQCELMQGELFSKLLTLENTTNFLSGKHDTLTKIINKKTFFDILSIKNR